MLSPPGENANPAGGILLQESELTTAVHRAHEAGDRQRSGAQTVRATLAIAEPVFANLRHNKRLDRFTLRTQPKVNTQWNLYCLVHNIEKLAHHGYGK